jgi:acyl dehydratase
MSGRYSELTLGEQFELAVEPVTTMQLVKYAGASDDYNRIHYDQAYAVGAGLGGVIAHGMLTMGFMGRAVTGWAGPQARIKHIAARFTHPVRPGDSVRVVGTVESKQTHDNVDGIQCKIVATVGDKAVASGEATVQWYPVR